MPELPEVEVIAMRLRAAVGRRVVRARVLSKKIVKAPATPRFVARLRGARIETVERRAKHLILRTDHGDLVLHLRMTGTVDIVRDEEPPFLRLALDLDDGTTVAFADRRHLGEARLVEDAASFLQDLGPEPFDEIDPALLTRSNRPIKAVLMDQSVLAGVGNIYSDEALYRARIHPLRPASSLSIAEARALLRAIRAALQQSIDEMRDEQPIRWRDLDDGPSPFLVYDRAGETCRRCGTKLTALKVAGRTAVVCPRCQRLTGRGRSRPRPRRRRRA